MLYSWEWLVTWFDAKPQIKSRLYDNTFMLLFYIVFQHVLTDKLIVQGGICHSDIIQLLVQERMLGIRR